MLSTSALKSKEFTCPEKHETGSKAIVEIFISGRTAANTITEENE
jgi:hypothetical protein